jgi:hypothetical protein
MENLATMALEDIACVCVNLRPGKAATLNQTTIPEKIGRRDGYYY